MDHKTDIELLKFMKLKILTKKTFFVFLLINSIFCFYWNRFCPVKHDLHWVMQLYRMIAIDALKSKRLMWNVKMVTTYWLPSTSMIHFLVSSTVKDILTTRSVGEYIWVDWLVLRTIFCVTFKLKFYIWLKQKKTRLNCESSCKLNNRFLILRP